MHEAISLRCAFYEKPRVFAHCYEKLPYFILNGRIRIVVIPLKTSNSRPFFTKYIVHFSFGSNIGRFVDMQPISQLA